MSDFEKKILEFKNRLNSTQDSKEIEAIRTDIFSKNGFINSQFKKLGSLSEDCLLYTSPSPRDTA